MHARLQISLRHRAAAPRTPHKEHPHRTVLGSQPHGTRPTSAATHTRARYKNRGCIRRRQSLSYTPRGAGEHSIWVMSNKIGEAWQEPPGAQGDKPFLSHAPREQYFSKPFFFGVALHTKKNPAERNS